MTTNTGQRPIRRALISVYDKTGLESLAKALHDQGVELVSTGGSAAALEKLGLPVTKVEDLTGFPECLDGRVKTLHPRVHAGLLADTTNPDHVKQLDDLHVASFDLLVSNLYPFTQTVASGAPVADCIEQIDIGGPAMLRAGAKNHDTVAVITNPGQYDAVIEAARGEGFTVADRQRFAAETYAHTAAYDVAVANWMLSEVTDTSDGTGFPHFAGATYQRSESLRYGENPHQKAALYIDGTPGIAGAEQLNGKAMSYNNYLDTDAALRAARDHGDQPTCAVVKHNNPCGIAVGSDIAEAHKKAHACDPVSAFGGIIAVNRPVTKALADQLDGVFTEVIAAPSYDQDALDVLTAKKNLRVLVVDPAAWESRPHETRPITGGLLVQELDRVDAVVTDEQGQTTGGDDTTNWTLVSGEAADEATLADLQFAWRAVRATKSNGILLANDGASVGVGMGQVNRVDSCNLAVSRAGEDRARGSVASSDAFFPFADGLQILLDAGVRAVVAPGGSVRDEEVIAAAQEAGVTMYFTGTRHFAH